MRSTNNQGNGTVILSIAAAMALRIVPWSRDLGLFNPDWVLLIVIYWCLRIPDRFNIGSAWIVGLLTDVLTGQLLGQHALVYSIVAYIVVRFYRRLRVFPMSQQILIVLLLLLLAQILVLWNQTIQTSAASRWTYWIPSCSGALAWPFVYILLGGFHFKAKIE